MGIEIKCFATLVKFVPENGDDYPIKPGSTVRTIVEELGIPVDDVTLIFINSCRSELDSPIKDGDRVGMFPPVGGG